MKKSFITSGPARSRGYKTFGDQSQTHGEYVPESEFITEVIKRLRSFSCSTSSLTLSSKRHNLEQAPALVLRYRMAGITESAMVAYTHKYAVV